MDQKLTDESSNATRKSSRKKSKSSLPPPAAALVSMVNAARLKLKEEAMTSAAETRKRKAGSSAGRTKSVKDFLLKNSTVYNSDFVEVACNEIESNLLCPICNHRSLVSLTTKEQADSENGRIQEFDKRKMEEWDTKGRIGSKPRMAKTRSQILGCMCYSQNCIGNNDGSGCFKCKSEGKPSKKELDTR